MYEERPRPNLNVFEIKVWHLWHVFKVEQITHLFYLHAANARQ